MKEAASAAFFVPVFFFGIDYLCVEAS